MKRQTHNRSTVFWLNNVAGSARFYVGVLLVIQVVLGASSICYAMLLRQLVNAAVDADRQVFFVAVAIFAALALFQIALRAAGRYTEEYTCAKLENRFKSRLFSTLLTGDYACVTAVHSGEWMNRLTSDTVVVANGMAQILPGVVGMLVKLVGAITAILWLEPSFLYILIPGSLLLILTSYAFRKIMKRLHKQTQEADGKLRVFLSERLSSLVIIRAFTREKQTEKQADSLMENHRRVRMNRTRFSTFCNAGFSVLIQGAYVLGAGFCGYGILTGTMSYGNLMAVLQLIGQIQAPFANISGFLPKYYAMLASAERLMEAEQFPQDCIDPVSEEECQVFYRNTFRGISLRNAAFTYLPPVQDDDHAPTMPTVVRNLNLAIQKGEYAAFTGPSGCGKSTVLKLLMCLYPLDEGECYLMTQAGEQSLTAQWRGLFAYVPQGNQLLSGTIREIVAFGDPNKMKQDAELRRSLEIACAWEFVSQLDLGLDTQLGERGAGLSEGQMQRLAVARAICSGHPILLLDEATSALDEGTEARLLANLRAMTDKTVSLVTHRPATLAVVDKVISFSSEGGQDS